MERKDTGRFDDPLIGRVLDGRYEVGAKVARGGMATVYQARDLRLDRIVAVKVMHTGLADDPEFVHRFEREARSAARLSHHNVVAVFDQGDDAGTLFLVMEYVPGLTLRDLIRKDAPLAPSKALAVIEPVLAALAAAHGAGMIHRDVKPENVLLADDGRIKVADFGLARAVNTETQHTATGGVLIGTVSYLSPELVVDGKADARSDVYAAGVLLYEMLTGQKPHQADSPIQVAYKHVHEDIPAPSLRVPGLPAYVDALVARATARDRDLRPSDARMLLHQVRRVRQALDHGVQDDPDLVADLLPNPRHDDSVPTGELPVDRGRVQPADEVYDHGFADADDFGDDRDDRDEYSVTTAIPRADAAVPPPRARPSQTPARPRPRRRSRRGLFLLVGVLLAALVVGIGAWQIGSYANVPSVVTLDKAAAQTKLTDAGFKVRFGTAAYDDKIPLDSVISTDPGPGDRASKGSTVTVTLSRGPDVHAVPLGRGKTLEEMRALLTKANLEVGSVIERHHETIPTGRVITTDPVAGEMKPRGAAVDIIMSKGPRPISITDYTGKNAAKATEQLTELGFKVTTSEEFSDTVAAGLVLKQTPNSGTGFKKDEITLVVSKGKEMIEVPAVRGKRTNDARKALQDAGFKVKTVRSSLYVGANYVVSVSPSGGSSAPKGSTVTITIV